MFTVIVFRQFRILRENIQYIEFISLDTMRVCGNLEYKLNLCILYILKVDLESYLI
jgi:hypothetical protein